MRTPVVRLQMVKERTLVYPTPLTGPEGLIAAARALIADEDREHFVVLYLDVKLRVTSVERIAVGQLDGVVVHPREVFKGALLANAHAIALAHNHPSGDPSPSAEDRALTARLIAAGEMLGIQVVDHVIVGDGDAVTLRATTGLWR